jgi:hypothetical protein
MNYKIYLIILSLAVITTFPTVNAQFSLGVEANQKLIEMKVDNSEIVLVKHVIAGHNMPVTLKLFEGTISNFTVTNENDEQKDVGIVNDGMGNESITIFPSSQDSIITYNLEDVNSFYDNIWTLRTEYEEKFGIIFSEEINLIFINNNVIELGDKKGISINGGGKVNLQYYSDINKIIQEVQWEEEKFNVEIITDSKINNFNFSQESKSIEFEIDSKNKFVTLIIEERLLGGPYVVLLNDQKIKYNKYIKDENSLLNIKPESVGKVTIIGTTVIPEFSMFIPLIMGFLVILTVPFIKKFNLH